MGRNIPTQKCANVIYNKQYISYSELHDEKCDSKKNGGPFLVFHIGLWMFLSPNNAIIILMKNAFSFRVVQKTFSLRVVRLAKGVFTG